MKRDAPEKLEKELLSRLSDQIRERIGLNFAPERWGDLERGLRGAAGDFGFQGDDATDKCAKWLLADPLLPAQIDTLARHLTIGETYFFRDPAVFEALRQQILPDLVRARQERGDKTLRFWSAACCSGEEPYSLAMLLAQTLPALLPDWRDWRISILATDLNPVFLQKAKAGIYSSWSFRDGAREEQKRFFTLMPDGRFQLKPEIRRMVQFARLNLIEDEFPSPLNGTRNQDVIFCRNVLMYFTKPQAGAVVEKLAGCLVEGGLLVPSASEASPQLFAPLRSLHWPRVILYKKDNAPKPSPRPLTKPSRPELPPPRPARKPAEPEKPDVAPTPREAPAETPVQWNERARRLANEGQLADALTWCEKAIAAEKMNARHHYLRASILMEKNGSLIETELSLKRAIYLEPDFALAHFALGNLARRRGDTALASKSFNTALRLLAQQDPQEILLESENLTSGHLAEVIAHTLEALSK